MFAFYCCYCQSANCKTNSSKMQYFSHIPLKDLNVELSNAPLKTTGTFPGWLSGSLIRNGPPEMCILHLLKK